MISFHHKDIKELQLMDSANIYNARQRLIYSQTVGVLHTMSNHQHRFPH